MTTFSDGGENWKFSTSSATRACISMTLEMQE